MVMRNVALVVLWLCSVVLAAASRDAKIVPAMVDDNPALQFCDDQRHFSPVVHSAPVAVPVLTFRLTRVDGIRHWYGVLSVSAERVSWQSLEEGGGSFDEPRTSVQASIYDMGDRIRLEFSGNTYKFRAANETGGWVLIGNRFEKSFYPFLANTVRDFFAADAAFWQMRGEKAPDLMPMMNDSFRGQAASWRARAVKPVLSEDANKQRVLAENYLREKEFKTAIEHYELGLRAGPMWPEGWFNLALLYGEVGNFSMAADRMKHYVELAPDSPDAASARDKIVVWEDKATKPKARP
jgi:hypothetical protein